MITTNIEVKKGVLVMSTKTEKPEKKQLTDADVKRKAVKLVVAHLKRKASTEFMGMDYLQAWLEDMEALLEKRSSTLRNTIECADSSMTLLKALWMKPCGRSYGIHGIVWVKPLIKK